MKSRLLKSSFVLFTMLMGVASAACSSPAAAEDPPGPTGSRHSTRDPDASYDPSQTTPPAPPPVVDGGSHPDTGPAHDAGPDTSIPDAGACNNVVTPPLGITMTGIDSNPPKETGGAIADGHYVLKESRVYTGAGGKTGQQQLGIAWAFDVKGDAWEMAEDLGTSMYRVNMSLKWTGATATVTCACGPCALTKFDVTADASGFRLLQDDGTEEVFVKQ